MIDYILLGLIVVVLLFNVILLAKVIGYLKKGNRSKNWIEDRLLDCYHKLDYIDKGQDAILNLLK